MIITANNSNLLQEVSLFKSHGYDDLILHTVLICKTGIVYVTTFYCVYMKWLTTLALPCWPWPCQKHGSRESKSSTTLPGYIVCHHDNKDCKYYSVERIYKRKKTTKPKKPQTTNNKITNQNKAHAKKEIL